MPEQAKRNGLPIITEDTANTVLSTFGINPDGSSKTQPFTHTTIGRNISTSELVLLRQANHDFADILNKAVEAHAQDQSTHRLHFQYGIGVVSRMFSLQMGEDYYRRVRRLSPTAIDIAENVFASHRVQRLGDYEISDDAAAMPILPDYQSQLERCLFFTAAKLTSENAFPRIQLGGRTYYSALEAALTNRPPKKQPNVLEQMGAGLRPDLVLDPQVRSKIPGSM